MASSSQAVWEHSPLTSATRLAGDQADVWEVAMVFTPNLFVPPMFTCPAGFRFVLHALNLSQQKIILHLASPERSFTLPAGGYQKIVVGKLDYGEHRLEIEIFPTLDPGLPAREVWAAKKIKMHCPIYAQVWPGKAGMHRLVLIARQGQLVPLHLRIPAGQTSEVFIAADPATAAFITKINKYSFEIKPGQITLTEVFHPRGSKLALPYSSPPAYLDIR